MRGRKSGVGRRIAALVAIIGLAALSGCTASSQGTPSRESGQLANVPDVSAKGRLDYACALVVDAKTNHGPVDSWNFAIGDDADPVLHELAGAGGLLGATSGAHVAGHRGLSEAAKTYYLGMVQLDSKKMQKGLNDLATGCHDEKLPAAGPDISASGRVSYACALASDVEANGGPAENWLTIGDKAHPAAYELDGAAGLLGAMTASHLPRHRDLSEAAIEIFGAVSRIDPELAQRSVHKLVKDCADR